MGITGKDVMRVMGDHHKNKGTIRRACHGKNNLCNLTLRCLEKVLPCIQEVLNMWIKNGKIAFSETGMFSFLEVNAENKIYQRDYFMTDEACEYKMTLNFRNTVLSKD